MRGREAAGSWVVPFWHTFQKTADHTPAEDRYLEDIQRFQKVEGAYAMIQGTRPRTLADSLNDSPAGLAAWLVEKFATLSDCHGEIESRFSKDELLTVHSLAGDATSR